MAVEPDPWAVPVSPDPWEPAPDPNEDPSLWGSAKKLGRSYQRMWNPDMPSEGAAYDLAANLTAAALPGALAYNAVTKLPQVARLTGLLPRALKHIGAGAAGGAAGAAATNTDTAEGAAYGAVLGPLTAVAAKIPGAATDAFRSVFGSPDRGASKALGTVFGNRTQEAARAAQNIKPNVPGEQFSTVMATTPRLSEFKALHNIAMNRPGAAAINEMDAATKAAHEAALLRYAKPGQPGVAPGVGQKAPKSKIGEVIKNKTGPKYEAVQDSRVPYTRAIKQAEAGAELRPLDLKAEKAMDQARANTRAQGGTPTPPRQFSLSIKEGQLKLREINAKIKDLEKSATPNTGLLTRLKDARTVITKELEKGSPEFAAINRQYAKLQVGNRQSKLMGELLKQVRKGPNQYLNAVDDPSKVLRKAGALENQSQLEQVLTPKQLQPVRGIEKTLAQRKAINKLDAREGIIKPYENVFDIAAANTPGVFSQTYTIFRKAMQKLGANSDEAVQEVVDQAMRDPAKMASLLNAVPSAQRQQVMAMIRHATAGAAAGAAGSSGEQNAP